MAIFCQKLYLFPIKYHFLAPIIVFCVRVVSWCSRYPFVRVLDSKEEVLHAIEAIPQLFQGY